MARQSDRTYIYGKHALEEALRNAPKQVVRVFVDPRGHDVALDTLIQGCGVKEEILDLRKLPIGIDENVVHQGYVAEVDLGRLMQEYRAFIEGLPVTSDTCLVLLGEIQDPQNVGAVIRSAAAFGIAGVLFPEHHQAQLSGAIVKVSAGMAFRVPLVAIGNVNTTIRDLKERGFWVYGLDGNATQGIEEESFEAPTLFVLGNEARGIREKTLEHCDIPLAIRMHPQCESLNAAASAAIALHTWSLKHPQALRS